MDLSLSVAQAQHGLRLDRLLASALPEFSRGAIQKAIADGLCQIDGKIQASPSQRLKTGQQIVFRSPESSSSLAAEDGEVQIIWHDDNLLVCNKNPGLTVHPCPSCPESTLVQRLLKHFPSLAQMEGMRPGIVHRIDKDTSGLLIVALNEQTRIALTDAFAQRRIHKEYLALVAGVPATRGKCHEPIGRDPVRKTRMAVVTPNHGGKEAHSEWRVLWTAPDTSCSLLAVRIHTGRTHQIRVHMAHVGHPLLGDALYAPASIQSLAPRQMLHAWHLEFSHPHTGELLRFSCPPPADMRTATLARCSMMQRIVVVGSPGCGKSALLNLLESRGFPVFSADNCVAELYGSNGAANRWLADMAGKDILMPDGSVDKQALFTAMQRDITLKRDVENMVHGFVKDRLNDFWQKHHASGTPLAVAEIPLYLECGWRDTSDVLVGVHCPLTTRIQRLEANRGWSREKIETMESWQWNPERKEKACDILVDNSGSLVDLARQTDKLCRELESRRQQSIESATKTIDAVFAS